MDEVCFEELELDVDVTVAGHQQFPRARKLWTDALAAYFLQRFPFLIE